MTLSESIVPTTLGIVCQDTSLCMVPRAAAGHTERHAQLHSEVPTWGNLALVRNQSCTGNTIFFQTTVSGIPCRYLEQINMTFTLAHRLDLKLRTKY